MNLFKKLFIPTGDKESITAYESWVVRWQSRNGEFRAETQPECEVFTSKEDAEKFASQLREAFRLIRHTSGNRVKVSKSD